MTAFHSSVILIIMCSQSRKLVRTLDCMTVHISTGN